MSKYKDHVYVIPEDDADRQIANGFVDHHEVKGGQIKVMPVAGGWPNVLKTFQDEYIQKLRSNPLAHVVMLIDFDGRADDRRAKFDAAIPNEIKTRVFVIGPKYTPERLKSELKKSFEEIGTDLAAECQAETTTLWNHDQLDHNDVDRKRLIQIVKPFIF